MKLSIRLLRPIRETAFGKYDILRPNKPRMNRKSSPYIPPLPVPFSIARPSYVPINFWSRKSEDDALVVDDEFSELEGWQGTIAEGGSSSDIGRIPLGGIEEQTVRYAGRLAAEVLNDAGRLVKAGMKTMDLDRALHDMIIAKDAYPSPLGYQGYPRSITTSINNVICHGIPDE